MPFPKKGDIVFVQRQSLCGKVIRVDQDGDGRVSLDVRIRHVLPDKKSLEDYRRILSLKAREINILDTPQKVFNKLKELERKSDMAYYGSLVNEFRNKFID